MYSNDALLCHLITHDENSDGKVAKLKVDELLFNPTKIEVAVNEVVYIYFICNISFSFNLEVITPTDVLPINSNTTLNKNSNRIIKALGNVQFNNFNNASFYVQFLRISY